MVHDDCLLKKSVRPGPGPERVKCERVNELEREPEETGGVDGDTPTSEAGIDGAERLHDSQALACLWSKLRAAVKARQNAIGVGPPRFKM
jgi:hypothetical protein